MLNTALGRGQLYLPPHTTIWPTVFTTYANAKEVSSDADDLYSSCMEVFTMCQKVKGDLVAVVDPDTGYAPRMNSICREL
jgi:hypothetical protein